MRIQITIYHEIILLGYNPNKNHRLIFSSNRLYLYNCIIFVYLRKISDMKFFIFSLFILVIGPVSTFSQKEQIRLYPATCSAPPDIYSPSTLDNGREVVVITTKAGTYGLVDVTPESGEPLYYSYKLGTFLGKDEQVKVGCPDFMKAIHHTGVILRRLLLFSD